MVTGHHSAHDAMTFVHMVARRKVHLFVLQNLDTKYSQTHMFMQHIVSAA